mmetsp:Transcript_21804/g.40114  ORF Transcript_21804/g.40114 Transcript_21804/m.40114 type:complete len:508 (-) Transcript_21804:32-1555(-)
METEESPAKRLRLADAAAAAVDKVEEDDILARVRALAEAAAASIASLSPPGAATAPAVRPKLGAVLPAAKAQEPLAAAKAPERGWEPKAASAVPAVSPAAVAPVRPKLGIIAPQVPMQAQVEEGRWEPKASAPVATVPLRPKVGMIALHVPRQSHPQFQAEERAWEPKAPGHVEEAQHLRAAGIAGTPKSAAFAGLQAAPADAAPGRQEKLQITQAAALQLEQKAEVGNSAETKAEKSAAGTEEVPDPVYPPDQTLYGLAQVAEESAQIASAVAAFCATTGCTDLTQVTTVCETSVQASKRANWASGAADSYEVPSTAYNEDEKEQMEAWVDFVRKTATEAAKVADKAAEECRTYLRQLSASQAAAQEAAKATAAAAAALGQDDPQGGGGGGGGGVGGPRGAKDDRGSRVPCRYHMAGRCVKGSACDFSHDAQDMQARPVFMKLDRPCAFFDRGQCLRGAACPFAHGQEELEEITKARAERAAEKGFGKGWGKYRMSWTPRGTLVTN